MPKTINPNSQIPHADTKNTPEHAMWYQVLETYFADLGNVTLSDIKIEAILMNARSRWTLRLCEMIGVDHGFLLRKLEELVRTKEKAREAYRKKRAEKTREALAQIDARREQNTSVRRNAALERWRREKEKRGIK